MSLRFLSKNHNKIRLMRQKNTATSEKREETAIF